MVLRIDGRRVDLRAGDIQGPDGKIRLEPRVLEVLQVLVRHRGELVSKAELLATVWPNTAVSDDVLWRCIAALRRAFGDDPTDARVIETRPRRGYRLIAEVGPVMASQTPRSHPSIPYDAVGRRHLAWGLGASIALAGAAALIFFAAISSQRGGSTAVTEPLSPAVETWSAVDLTRAGREYYRRRTPDATSRAIELFERAVSLDPNHALAWAGLADSHARRLDVFDADLATGQRALQLADRAVALGPQLPESHKARGYVLANLGRTQEAMGAYRRALELAPDFTPAAVNLGVMLGARGRYGEALALYTMVDTRTLERAIDLHNIGEALYYVGRYGEARRYLTAALTVDPLQVESVVVLTRLDLIGGRLDTARRRVEEALAAQPAARQLLIAAAEVEAVTGNSAIAQRHLWSALEDAPRDRYLDAHIRLIHIDREQEGEARLDEFLRMYREQLPAAVALQGSWELAQVAAAVALVDGDQEAALSWLRRAADLGHIDARWLSVDPLFTPLHGDPEFRRLSGEIAERWRTSDAQLTTLVAAGPLDRASSR